jgi:Ca2+/H+ antiporter, TMEM165/GDT1 family
MAALMIALVACALSATGGRWWQIAAAAARHGTPGQAAVLSGVALVASAAGWLGKTTHDEVAGRGMMLFLAIALLLAGASALWPARPLPPKIDASLRGPVSSFVIALAALISDSGPFIILAAAAWTGEWVLAAAGGAAGLAAAAVAAFMLPANMVGVWITAARRIAGGLFLIIGAVTALAALGLL